jgi:diphosphomevalonate decarboxylase
LKSVTCTTGPSLALIKYWGKSPLPERNLPATTSLAMTLDPLATTTKVTLEVGTTEPDQVSIQGKVQNPQDAQGYFSNLKQLVAGIIRQDPHGFAQEIQDGQPYRFIAESTNNFPTAAGLASSASGYAALTGASVASLIHPELQDYWFELLSIQEAELHHNPRISLEHLARHRYTEPNLEPLAKLPGLDLLSRIARFGSGSASRSVFGGYTLFPKDSPEAHPLAPSAFWPQLRIVLVPVSNQKKPVSSRDAMNLSRDTSPYYQAWIDDAELTSKSAQEAFLKQDLEQLGQLMRVSYLRMFSTMFSSNPPVMFWLPGSVTIMKACEELRGSGIPAWETMDAGPQVKILTLEKYTNQILQTLGELLPDVSPVVCAAGPGLRFTKEEL